MVASKLGSISSSFAAWYPILRFAFSWSLCCIKFSFEINHDAHLAYRVVVGSVNGKFTEVFQKISTLHSKNKFAFALVAGDLFRDESSTSVEDTENVENLLNGKIKVPLPTYFGMGAHSLPDAVIKKLEVTDGEVCENLVFLGKRTTFKTSDGVRIVALGGALDPNVTGDSLKDKFGPFYSENDAKILRGAKTADILLTSQWPTHIRAVSKVEFDEELQPESQDCIAGLCEALRPRYHFSTSDSAFYEREPFTQSHEGDDVQITRFISLAAFGNSSKSKWVYAFSLDPTAAPLTAVPTGVTSSPFAAMEKKRPSQTEPSQYRYASDEHNYHSHDRPRKRKRHEQHEPLKQEQCFFCLSNPNLATHIIASIGDESYLTTAKGPLTTRNTFSSLPFSGHMLLIPLSHSPTLSLIADPDSRKKTIEEMHHYRDAMQNMLKSLSSTELGAVTWEISRSSGFHVHWQWIPCALSIIQKGLIEAAFKVEAENLKYPGFYPSKPTSRDPDVSHDDEGDYFRVMVWNSEDGKDKEMRLPLDSSFKFDVQFGRRVMSKLLRLEDRIDWHDCGQSHEDEVADVEEFKAAFKKYDFSL